MSRAADFVIASVLIMVSGIIHLISIELFNVEGALYGIATDGTEVLNGAERAAFWSEFFIVWLPMMVAVAAMAWVVIREYRRQVQTGVGQQRPRP